MLLSSALSLLPSRKGRHGQYIALSRTVQGSVTFLAVFVFVVVVAAAATVVATAAVVVHSILVFLDIFSWDSNYKT